MSKSTRRVMDRGNWIAVALAAGAAAAFMLLSFIPQMHAIWDAHAQLQSKLTYVLDAQKSARVTEALRHELAEVLAYIDQYDDQLMTQERLPVLYRQISQSSKARNAVTTKFEPHPAVAYDSLQTASLSLGVKGPFAAIHGLVRDLEALRTRVWIDDIKIRGPRESGKPAECDIILVVFIDNPEETD